MIRVKNCQNFVILSLIIIECLQVIHYLDNRSGVDSCIETILNFNTNSEIENVAKYLLVSRKLNLGAQQNHDENNKNFGRIQSVYDKIDLNDDVLQIDNPVGDPVGNEVGNTFSDQVGGAALGDPVVVPKGDPLGDPVVVPKGDPVGDTIVVSKGDPVGDPVVGPSINAAGPVVYVVTPTYKRMTQKADMVRLAQTLMNLDFVFWVVVEDGENTSPAISDVLRRSGLPHHYIAAPTPPEYRDRPHLGRGVFNRRAALAWLRAEEKAGVLYFADDDNTYDISIFHQMRHTLGVSVFPVGMILQYGISSPVVREGKVVAFHDAFQAGRKFPIDMAGFAVNLSLLHSHPLATIAMQVSYLEDGFLKGLGATWDDLEPLADQCTKVLVWHTRTRAPATPNLDNVPEEYRDTNLPGLYSDVLQ